MRFQFSAALLLGAAACLAHAAPPGKRLRPASSRVKTLPDIPAAGASGELVDLDSGRSHAIAPMLENRTDFQATTFPDGRVLITGGSLQGGTTEWFDPATRRFSPGPSMAQARQGHRALLLKDGRLVVVGGTEAPAPAEVFDIATGKFQPLKGDVRLGLSAQAVETSEGLLLIDGQEGKCWLWDGQAKAPRTTGSLNRPRLLFEALKLADGRVLLTGGWPSAPQSERRGWRRPAPANAVGGDLPVEVFQPRKGKWSTWKTRVLPRARHQATLLPDGKIALFGGFGERAEAPVEAIEVLDPLKETATVTGSLPVAELPSPGWSALADGGLFLGERSTTPRRLSAGSGFTTGTSSSFHLANAYLAPVLVPLGHRQLLVLGSAVWGPALERWDPRTRQWQYIGALRAGSEALALLSGRVLALGPIVDSVEPKSGNLTPLGRREDLGARLKKAQSMVRMPGPPPFPVGCDLRDSLVIPLASSTALVMGGRSEANPEGTDQVWIWDLRKKSLTPTGPMKAKRFFPSPSRPGQGALRLPDGSVLIWSGQ